MTSIDSADERVEAISLGGAAVPTSLSDFAYTSILELMLAGKLKPGTVLQERKLAEVLAMSRTPVREALSRLEAESMIERSHGRAPVVSDVSVESFISLLDMRRILEMEAAARATGRISAETAKAVVAAIHELTTNPSPTTAQHWAVDELVHSTIAEAAGNPLVTQTIRDLRRRTHLFNTNRLPQRLIPGASEHLNLIAAVTGSDPERSRQLMAQHLDNVREAIIQYLIGAKRS